MAPKKRTISQVVAADTSSSYVNAAPAAAITTVMAKSADAGAAASGGKKPRKSSPAKSPKAAQATLQLTPDLLAKAKKLQLKLNQLYPDPPIPLDHSSSFQLLVAVVLSAQTTDKKVNEVTPALFAAGPTAEAMAKLEVRPPSTSFCRIKNLKLNV